MITNAQTRSVIATHMERKKIARHALQKLSGMPMSSVYQFFNDKRDSTIAFESVSRVLEALGLSFAWLEREATKITIAKVANGRGAKMKPTRARKPVYRNGIRP